MENIIVNITIGLMVLKILYNIISGYLSVNPSKKKYFGRATPRIYFIKLQPIPAMANDQKKCLLISE